MIGPGKLRAAAFRRTPGIIVLLVCGLTALISAAALLASAQQRERLRAGSGSTVADVSPYAAPLHQLLRYLEVHPDPLITPILDELLRVPAVPVEEARQLYHGALNSMEWCAHPCCAYLL